MRRLELFILMAFCLSNSTAFAQSGKCDASLDPTPDAEGYKQRGGVRCEGTYVSRVSGPALELVSLTWGAVANALRPNGMLLTIPGASGISGPIHLRAIGIPPGLYYRMDAEIAPGGSLEWPPGAVLEKLNVGLSEIGVFGFARDSSGEIVYLPVALNGPTPDAQDMVIELRPLTAMDEAKWRFIIKGASPNDWSPATLADDRLTISMHMTGTLLPGTLQVSWTDPDTGRARMKNFELRP